MRKYEKRAKEVIEATTTMTISLPLWQAMKIFQEAKTLGISRSALISKFASACLGTARPVIFAGSEDGSFTQDELDTFARVEEEIKQEKIDRAKTMEELLPPPELDPDLKGV